MGCCPFKGSVSVLDCPPIRRVFCVGSVFYGVVLGVIFS